VASGKFGGDFRSQQHRRRGRIIGMGSFFLRAALTGVTLWVVTLIVPGMHFTGGHTTLQKVGIIFVVAVIFGLVNAIIKPIVQILSIPLYILTLGLFHIVINALMLWITAAITRHTTHWGLQIDHFWWTAIWAAIGLVDCELAAVAGSAGHQAHPHGVIAQNESRQPRHLSAEVGTLDGCRNYPKSKRSPIISAVTPSACRSCGWTCPRSRC
jgi:putative membrane protein